MKVSLRGLGWVGLLFAICVAGCQGKHKAARGDKGGANTASPDQHAQLRWDESDTEGGLPIQLTASDGQGLTLVSVSAQVIAQPPLAFTELHLRFHNPEPRVREGRFEITLPETAAISRFAMRVGEQFQEGEVVERKAAQEAYEDFLHRRQDPALLEQDAGNHFRARVFPIPASADKEIIISYSEELSDPDKPYRLHLAGLPTMQSLAVRVLAESGEMRVDEERFAPRGDLVLTGGQGAAPGIALRAGDLYMARVTPALDASPAELKGFTVLLDSSASMALGYRARVERLTHIIDGLRGDAKADFPLEIIAFDQGSVPLFKGNASELRGRGEAALLARSPLGASNLSAALESLAKGSPQPRLLIVTDAVITAGSEEDAELTRHLKQLGERGVRRADVMLVGGIHERAVAQRLINVLGERGLVMDEQRTDEELRFALTHRPSADLSIEVSGATWWWPRSVSAALPGESLLVMASLKSANKSPSVRVGKQSYTASSVLEVNEPLLRRAWARAKINDLSERLALLDPTAIAQRASLAAEMTAISTRHRVLSAYTALLVLETEADYQRFGIARTALSDILVVGERGLQVLSGKQRGMAIAAPVVSKGKAEEAARESATERRAEAPRGGAEAEGDLLAAASGGAAADVLGQAAGAPASAPKAARSAAPPPPSPAEVRPQYAPATAAPRDDRAALEALGYAPSGALSAEPTMRPRAATGRIGSSSGLGALGAANADGYVVPERYMAGRVRFTESQPPRPAGAFESNVVSAELRKRLRAIQICYEQSLRSNPTVQGTIEVEFRIDVSGTVPYAQVISDSTGDGRAMRCITDTVRRFRFNPPPSELVLFAYRFELAAQEVASAEPRFVPDPQEVARQREWQERPKPNLSASLEGRLLTVLAAVEAHDAKGALSEAWRWRAEDPSSVLALLGLGAALAENGEPGEAARAYGSLIDLFPSRADLRRTAGHYLERLQQTAALELALDTYRRAREQRPDHPNSHRLYAWALVKVGRHQEALNVLHQGYSRTYPAGRFAGVERILRDDARIVASAWQAAQPGEAKVISEALAKLGVERDGVPSLRFVMSWETDANDVDFHIYDGKHGHAYYGHPTLPSGGTLFADVTTGYGPECFRIDRPKSYPYELSAHYYSRGPMGYGMGKVQVMSHDGRGHLSFDERPFVVMKDRAFVHMGVIKPLPETQVAQGG